MIRVCLIGVGKTGKEIAKVLLDRSDIELVSVFCSPSSDKEGKDLGCIVGTSETGIRIESTDRLEENLLKYKPDVVVDFSMPEATLKNAEIVSQMKINMVIGTTGFNELDLKKIENLTQVNHNGIIYVPNITLGVNVMMVLVKLTSILLNNYDFHISEIHHKNKKDSPSGTALKIAKEIEEGLIYSGRDVSSAEIPIAAVRAGGVISKHEVLIVGEHDRITISHESFSRKIFALGAIHAINFLQNKVGFYEMSDVLCLSKVIEDLYISKQADVI
ncbi:4-hydroxy-tetrahydrodipicolinate reductase [Clostridium thailandense]|uniref:4-hydroxy-tetrahydrodipicolinate reductase n=1 Tax=Clostridium thailandense TaxID=2794346 RepID=UPI00398A4B3D